MTVTLLVSAIVSLVWMAGGLAMIVASTWWMDRIERALADPLGRLLLGQAAILIGLLLLLGTPPLRGAWLWMSLGAAGVIKGLVILGAGEALRTRMVAWWRTLPPWAQRLGGVLFFALATLLMIDALGVPS
jgi:hypothetical protein